MTIGQGLGSSTVLDLADGQVRVWDTGLANRSAVETVVLVHGIIANADVWRDVVPVLARSCRVLTLDLPMGGHDLPMGEGADFSLFGLADLVARILTTLRLDRVTLVGNDTGGAVCQAVAARHPERVARLVLTPCDAFDNFLPRWIRHLQLVGRSATGLHALALLLRYRWVQRLPIAFGRLTVRPIPPVVMASYVTPLRTDDATRRDFAKLVTAISTRYTEEAAAGLPAFSRPALIVWGGEDRGFFPLAHAQRLAGLLPYARLVIVPGGGAFLAEDRPHELAAHIAGFIRETSTGAA